MKSYCSITGTVIFLILLSGSCINNNESTQMTAEKTQYAAIENIRSETRRLIDSEGRQENLFSIQKEKAVLLVIDMQNFVCAPENEHVLPGIKKIIETTNSLVDRCHVAGIPVIWVRHHIPPEGKQGLYPIFHNKDHLKAVEYGNRGTEIYAGMHIDHDLDHVVFKERYSAFMPDPSNSDMQKTLIELERNQLIVCGMATNVCVESTVRDAMQMDYEVILISDATKTYSEIIKESTLSGIQLLFGDVRNSESVIQEISHLTSGE